MTSFAVAARNAQRDEARHKANRIRSQRKKLKLDIKEKRETAWAYLIAPPQFIEGMKVYDLLSAAPKVGPVKLNQIMLRNHIAPDKKIGDLTERQRMELAEKVRQI